MPVRRRASAKDRVKSPESKGAHQQVRASRPTLRFVQRFFSRYRNATGVWTPNPITALMLLVMTRVAGALTTALADCDEVFNYWEPLHYMLWGRGLQTWEYSPRFALRSYAYLAPFAAIAAAAESQGDKIDAFYAVRIVQALFSAFAEAALYDSAVWRFGPARARVFLACLVFSPGIFRAALELLPSSFAMIALCAAYARWLVGDFEVAVAFVALAALFGWVYAAAAAVPMALHVMYRRGVLPFMGYALTAAIPLVALMVVVDSYYYGRMVLVPLLHVLYNVFPVDGAGPELFGVEPLSYYVVNMLLNVPLAVPILGLLPLQAALQMLGARVWGDAKEGLNRIIFLTGPLVMGAMMASVPHKEERFLAPLYPLLALLSAVFLVDWIDFVGRAMPSNVGGGVTKLLSFVVVCFCALLGVSRAYMQVNAFGAPLRVYSALARKELQKLDAIGDDINLCVGKEWHRFPSHFFIPNARVRVRFLRHGFDGALPRYYADKPLASRVHQDGMNMFNRASNAQWFNVTADGDCHYFVDLDLSHRRDNERIGYNQEEEAIAIGHRQVIYWEKFLDSEHSPAGLRAFWIPHYADRLVYGRYIIVRNTAMVSAIEADNPTTFEFGFSTVE